jgi:hypothetical protein
MNAFLPVRVFEILKINAHKRETRILKEEVGAPKRAQAWMRSREVFFLKYTLMAWEMDIGAKEQLNEWSLVMLNVCRKCHLKAFSEEFSCQIGNPVRDKR